MAMVVGTLAYKDKGALFTGIAGTGDNAIVLETTDISQFTSFTIMSSDGAFDIDVSLDGTNFAAAITMQDMSSATDGGAHVVVAAADKIYNFAGNLKVIRVRQNGSSPAVADLVMRAS